MSVKFFEKEQPGRTYTCITQEQQYMYSQPIESMSAASTRKATSMAYGRRYGSKFP